jgi:Tol biopolymer transport system component
MFRLKVPLLPMIAAVVACGQPRFEVVYTLSPPTWFEDGWSYYDVSPGGEWVAFGARFGFRLIDLRAGTVDSAHYAGLDQARAAAGAWPGRSAASLEREIPAGAQVEWSPGGEKLAFFIPGGSVLGVGFAEAPVEYELGGPVTGVGWVPAGDVLYALVLQSDGSSSLMRIILEFRTVEAILENLDAPHRFNSIAVSPDGRKLYFALAGAGPPNAESRHRPDADRDTDIYAYDLRDRRLERVVADPGDDFHPLVRGEFLYWTHNEMNDAIVVVPASGGEARLVIEGAQIPAFSHDGRELAFTYGGWRIADWALNLDVAAVAIDDSVKPVASPRPLVRGYHEDFTPSWSPDGRWIAYHSHRSSRPVPSYASPGSTDDIYLRKVGDLSGSEIRLTDFGWEVGMADWSPDGRRLVFDSWERGGEPGLAKPWIVTIDPETGRRVDLRRLPLPPSVRGTLLAAWSPKGDEIAVIAQGDGRRRELWVLSPDGRRAERLVEFEGSTYGGVDWTPDGELLIYSALAGETMQLFAVARAGGPPRQLTRDAASLIHPQVSPDGRWIAATRVERRKELRRMKL